MEDMIEYLVKDKDTQQHKFNHQFCTKEKEMNAYCYFCNKTKL